MSVFFYSINSVTPQKLVHRHKFHAVCFDGGSTLRKVFLLAFLYPKFDSLTPEFYSTALAVNNDRLVSYFSKPHYSLRFHAASISFMVQNTLQVHVVMTIFCMFSMSGRWSLPLSLHPFSLLA